MADSGSSLHQLAQPLQLPCGHRLPNRLGKSAMSETLATYDNRVTPELPALYRTWAASGIGLLITGNVMIDRRALGEPGNVALEDASDMALLQEWARAATQQGVDIWMQLNHPGKQSPKGLNRETVSPSAVPFNPQLAGMFATPRALSATEIEDLIVRFGRSAALAKAAGFTGVQIHGAHGYLVSQFLSPHHNRREDDWGGSPEKRRRFVLAVYAEIRKQVGAHFPIGIKLNSADFQRGGFSEEESMETIEALASAGMDLIEVSGGTYEAPVMTGHAVAKASTAAREAYFLEFAEKLRGRVQTPLMVTGGFRSVQGMTAALASNALDVVGLGRPLAIEPDVAARLLRGEDPREQVRAIKTGIAAVDRMAIMEIYWYERQIKRIAQGKLPQPRESGLKALFGTIVQNGWGTFRTRRARS